MINEQFADVCLSVDCSDMKNIETILKRGTQCYIWWQRTNLRFIEARLNCDCSLVFYVMFYTVLCVCLFVVFSFSLGVCFWIMSLNIMYSWLYTKHYTKNTHVNAVCTYLVVNSSYVNAVKMESLNVYPSKRALTLCPFHQ